MIHDFAIPTLEFTPQGVLSAYQCGIFPMADEVTGEIEWYLPDPRTILPFECLHVSRRLARTIRSGKFEVRFNTSFERVMRACADRAEGSWISDEFVGMYSKLHRLGFAHSVESWRDGSLAGGLYGVAIGGAFMGESMFHWETDASKVALVALVERLQERGFRLLDAQLPSAHLSSLAAIQIPAIKYLSLLQKAIALDCDFDD